VNFRRLAFTAAAATLATAAVAPAAHAATTVWFDVSQGSSARVELSGSSPYTRLDVLRNGAVIGSSASGRLDLADLLANDVVTVYNGAAIVATVPFDGLPMIGNDACVGHSSFTVQRGANAQLLEAGAYDEYGDDVPSMWSDLPSATVRLTRPLAPYDVAYAQTYASDGLTTVYASRVRRMHPCESEAPNPPPTPPAPPAPPVPPVTPSELTPTTGQMTQAVKGSLSATGSSLRARTTRRLARASTVALPFAFPEPGRVELQLVANNQVIGSGAKTSAVNGKVILSVQLTPAGRKLLKRAKKLKVTVKGAFTATRSGAETSRASSTVTLKR
jgi:hypothetical protein